jgi:hypothetical protein
LELPGPVVALAWSLRLRAVNLLGPDDDEDDYLRAGQEFAGLIRSSDWRGFTEINYRSGHPPLAKILIGASLTCAPEHPLIPEAPTSYMSGAQPWSYLGSLAIILSAPVVVVFLLQQRPQVERMLYGVPGESA